jgi:hypothetical protein
MSFFPENFETFILQTLQFHSVRHVFLKPAQKMDQLSLSNILFVYTKPLENEWETGKLTIGHVAQDEVDGAMGDQQESQLHLWGGVKEDEKSIAQTTADMTYASGTTQTAVGTASSPSSSRRDSGHDYSKSQSYSSSKSSSRSSS